MPKPSMEGRFWANVGEPDSGGCWPWTGSTNGDLGYSRLWNGSKLIPAHRFAYELLVGPIPDGLEIDHLCRNRGCVNPAHMEPVTHRENTLRGHTVTAVNAHKTHCLHGHEFTPENTYHHKDRFGRSCRKCQKIRSARYRKRK